MSRRAAHADPWRPILRVAIGTPKTQSVRAFGARRLIMDRIGPIELTLITSIEAKISFGPLPCAQNVL
jgi:hypothetical protein